LYFGDVPQHLLAQKLLPTVNGDAKVDNRLRPRLRRISSVLM